MFLTSASKYSILICTKNNVSIELAYGRAHTICRGVIIAIRNIDHRDTMACQFIPIELEAITVRIGRTLVRSKWEDYQWRINALIDRRISHWIIIPWIPFGEFRLAIAPAV